MSPPLTDDDTTDNLYPALLQCFTVIIAGYIAGRFNVITPTESKGIGTFVGNFALPCLIFLSLAELDFSVVNWWFLLAMLIAKALVFFIVMIVSLLVAKPLNLGRAGLLAIFCTQSNDFAIGYPIIVAVYSNSHPEYAAYLYLMAPISLVILNPIAFVMMEIAKDRDERPALNHNIEHSRTFISHLQLALKIMKGVATNPIVFMTALGVVGNLIFKHSLPFVLSGILKVFGSAFSGTALFLLGLRMVGKVHHLKGPALLLPIVLIIVKLLVLPVIMKETVSIMHAGVDQNDTQDLATYGFLYGTFPSAPAVFVFASQYSLDVDLIASCMVACTFISAPLMYISAHMVTITMDYAPQLSAFGFDVSIVAAVASVWMILFFLITRKLNRLPHRVTFCLALSQLIMSIGVIWGGLTPEGASPWAKISHEAVKYYGILSCRLWTAALAVVLVFLQSRGPCFVLKLFPVFCAIAWGIPLLIVILVISINGVNVSINSGMTMKAIAVAWLSFCLFVSVISLVLYVRFRKRNARYMSLSADVSAPPDDDLLPASVSGNETTSLIENQEDTSKTDVIPGYSNGALYGSINSPTSPTRNNCCGGSTTCENAGLPNANTTNAVDIEDLVLPSQNSNRCMCPANTSQHDKCAPDSEDPCPYLEGVERAAVSLGLTPPEQSEGRGGQLMRHTVIIVAYTLSMFLGLGYSTWSLLLDEMSGIYVELRFLDIILNYGQSLILWATFGIDPQEILLPIAKFWRKIRSGADVLTLTPLDELSFETKHVCEQFITHHMEKCKEAIAKDTKWRMKTYRGVFRGSCLVHWICSVGLARDPSEAEIYGRHLLEGRLIAHINSAHHFHNSPLLYMFI